MSGPPPRAPGRMATASGRSADDGPYPLHNGRAPERAIVALAAQRPRPWAAIGCDKNEQSHGAPAPRAGALADPGGPASWQSVSASTASAGSVGSRSRRSSSATRTSRWSRSTTWSTPQMNALLFKHDSTYGAYPGDVEAGDDAIIIDGREIKVLAEQDPARTALGRPRRRHRDRVAPVSSPMPRRPRPTSTPAPRR